MNLEGKIYCRPPRHPITHRTKIGEGTYGNVYLNPKNHREVIKQFKVKNLHESTIREISTLSLMRHSKYIVNLTAVNLKKHEIHLVRAEKSLEEYVTNNMVMMYESVWKMVYNILQALNTLENSNITHRDLKPSNILVDNGVYKLCDFGLAKFLTAEANYELSGGMQTLNYRSPEMILDTKYQLDKIDIWSLGIIAIELLSGFRLFKYSTDEYTHLVKLSELFGRPDLTGTPYAGKILATEPKPLSEIIFQNIPNEFYNLLEDMTYVDYHQRLTAAELLDKYFGVVNEIIAPVDKLLSISMRYTVDKTRLAQSKERECVLQYYFGLRHTIDCNIIFLAATIYDLMLSTAKVINDLSKSCLSLAGKVNGVYIYTVEEENVDSEIEIFARLGYNLFIPSLWDYYSGGDFSDISKKYLQMDYCSLENAKT